MIADLHAHFPMHLMPPEQADTHAFLTSPWPGAGPRAVVLEVLSRLANYQGPGGGPGVTVDLMRKGDVGVVLSVLYAPFDEMDLSERYAAPPRSRYVRSLQDQLQIVEREIEHEGDRAVVAHTAQELDAAVEAGRVAIVHCVEGGFALGADAAEIDRTVTDLAGHGVAYVSLAHLFFRGIATNVPALPFLPEALYKLLFPQRAGLGLTPLGEAAVRAMAREHVLVDITHMSERAVLDTFALLDATGERVPVIASHMACRFGALEYNTTDAVIRAVADRGGVLGVIACDHYLRSGLRRRKISGFEDSVKVVCAHIDRVREVAGSDDHVAIGSDLDGYIKPTVPGLEHMGRMRALQDALVARYGATVAEKICSGNVLALLRRYWR